MSSKKIYTLEDSYENWGTQNSFQSSDLVISSIDYLLDIGHSLTYSSQIIKCLNCFAGSWYEGYVRELLRRINKSKFRTTTANQFLAFLSWCGLSPLYFTL